MSKTQAQPLHVRGEL